MRHDKGLIGLSFIIFHILFCISATAQVGDHRSEFAVGVNGGYAMSRVGFLPKVPQDMYGGMTMGVTARYTSEKYFKSICAIVAEVNYTQMGWKESILTIDDEPVINSQTGLAEEYQRNINYVQVPIFARLGWGRERRGLQAYFQAGPQLGFYLGESTTANFDLENPNLEDRTSLVSSSVKNASNMYFMPVENKFDYGIAVGLGVEFSHTNVGHFLLEGRYYYGLGNIYGSTKRDYFAISNYGTIYVKMSYLFDISKSKNDKIK
jgi:hypothetical protein